MLTVLEGKFEDSVSHSSRILRMWEGNELVCSEEFFFNSFLCFAD